MGPEDVETAVLLRMCQNGLVVGRYGSREDVRKNIAWVRMASCCRVKAKFGAPARRLVKKGLLTDDGKSMRVLSLAMAEVLRVKRCPAANPGAPDGLDSILEK